MNWSRARLKEMARVALQGSYWKCVLVNLILTIVTLGFGNNGGASTVSRGARQGLSGSSNVLRSYLYGGSGVLPNLFSGLGGVVFSGIFMITLFIGIILACALTILVFNPLEVSGANFFKEDLYRPVNLDLLHAGFSPNYWNVVKTQFLRKLYTVLWTFVFIIPGIMKAYEYMMMPYIMAEHPDMPTEQVFELSKRMMEGEKMEAFILDLSFIGWDFLSSITGGLVGIFYVGPYKQLTHAALYGALKQKIEMQGGNVW